MMSFTPNKAHSETRAFLATHCDLFRPSLFGGLDSGLDCGTGLWDWTVGLDSQKVALIVSSD